MSNKRKRLSRRAILGTAGLATAGALTGSPVYADHDEPTEEQPDSCEGPGFNDTPRIPNSEWRVSDACRPEPTVVDPGKPMMGGTPPSDAEVLLAKNPGCVESPLEHWEHEDGSDPQWTITDEYIAAQPDTGFLQTKNGHGDAQIHVEWATPPNVEGENQEPGNSGVWMQSNYEIQILNSYENETYADGHAGAVYGEHPPLVNAARPPGEWQTFDILWTAPRFSDGDLESPAVVTVLWNGVVVQNQYVVKGPTLFRDVAEYEEHGDLPLQLQDHGQPVRFRNIWLRSLSSESHDEDG